jgi:hypothetical protein
MTQTAPSTFLSIVTCRSPSLHWNLAFRDEPGAYPMSIRKWCARDTLPIFLAEFAHACGDGAGPSPKDCRYRETKERTTVAGLSGLPENGQALMLRQKISRRPTRLRRSELTSISSPGLEWASIRFVAFYFSVSARSCLRSKNPCRQRSCANDFHGTRQ